MKKSRRLRLRNGLARGGLGLCLLAMAPLAALKAAETARLVINDREYLEMPGLNVMLAHDYYPSGHQGGVGIIQNGQRVATNGDLRFDRTPGQWQPVPKVGPRQVDRTQQAISVHLEYPDPEQNRTGFNPISYPDLALAYTVRVLADGAAFRIFVDLEKPLPDAWIGKIGFNLELYPGILFGKTFRMDDHGGIFPRQANGPGVIDAAGEYQIAPLATGKKLVVAPESERQRLAIESLAGGALELVDGRGQHTNGWFVVRSLVTPGATRGAIEWRVSPHAIPDFKSDPVVQVSQVGYHPKQPKIAVIELDARDTTRLPAILARIGADGGFENVLESAPAEWGHFLRFNYLRFDFTRVEQPGMYVVRYGAVQTAPFQISADVFQRHVWQPTLEYFLPIQMCHMRVNDRYRVWHGACHLDDARMAPINHLHFDGYRQGPSTLCRFQSGEPVPGLNRGGWHDAGDFDLRIESQVETVYGLALAREAFGVDYDNTTIDEEHGVVEIHRPDGKPDILQQMEHGLLSIIGGYESLGRFYRGIQEATLRQYTMLGDPVNVTDGKVFDPRKVTGPAPTVGLPGSPDDRWVFTEDNPYRDLNTAAGLAAAARVLRGYNDPLASQCLLIAERIWTEAHEEKAKPSPWEDRNPHARIHLAVELLLTTKDRRYADYLVRQRTAICDNIRGQNQHEDAPRVGWIVGRVLPVIGDAGFTEAVTAAVRVYRTEVDRRARETPYGVPYRPEIWGAGWDIQGFGMEQYFLHTAFPEIFPRDLMLHALDFILGCHPGANTASFVSGVGAKSTIVAYGFNRADGSYLPGGSVSGTALIRPDFPELLEWPFLWQQTEYVLGSGTTDYLFLVLAADHLLNR